MYRQSWEGPPLLCIPVAVDSTKTVEWNGRKKLFLCLRSPTAKREGKEKSQLGSVSRNAIIKTPDADAGGEGAHPLFQPHISQAASVK